VDRSPGAPLKVLGRYAVYDEIASGGMATVHLGRLQGPAGFSRTVAIKRLHPQRARDPEFVAMMLDEARLAAGIRHPNVVSTLDVVASDGELFLVMDYVEGESLARLFKQSRAIGERVPLPIVSSIVTGMLWGLHAAHETKADDGTPLDIVHRDVSPQNVLVGIDGVARVVDFGVAKASRRVQGTESGQLKGKLAYMAPEQLRAGPVDRRVDVFASGIVLWELVVGERLFDADEHAHLLTLVNEAKVEAPSRRAPGISPELDRIVLRALSRARENRFATAREMAIELEHAVPPALPRVVAEWVERLARQSIAARAAKLGEILRSESESLRVPLPEPPPSAPLPIPVSSPSHDTVAELPSQTMLVTWKAPAPESLPPKKKRVALIGAIAGGVAFALLSLGFFMARAANEPAEVRELERFPEVRIAPLASAPPPEPTPPPEAKSAEPPAPKPRAAPRANCNPPWSVGSDGIRRFKRECLGR
jgi:serine/threonine-protein kinase